MATRSEPSKEEHTALAEKFKGRKRSNFQKGYQRRENSKGVFKGKSFDVSKVKCYSCNKMGHFVKDCWSKIKSQKRGKYHSSTMDDDE